MQIRLRVFKGTKPRVNPKLVANENAQIARNCDLRFGDLRPLAGLTQVAAIAKPGAHRSLFLVDGKWISWTAYVDAVFAPVYNKDRRFIFTGDGEPKKSSSSLATTPATYPTTAYGLGVPAPALPLTVTLSPATSTKDILRSSAYVYTYVTGWGEESAPSDTTAVFEVKTDQTTTLSVNASVPTGYNITAWRIYRLASGTKSAEYQFLAEVSTSSTTYADSTQDKDLGEAIQTEAYAAPVTPWNAAAVYPAAGLRVVHNGIMYLCRTAVTVAGTPPASDPTHWEVTNGLAGVTELSNGVLAAFIENELYMTPPFVPYAWPLSYNLTAAYPIVALGHYSNTLVVLTEGYPYVSDGQDPSSAGLTKLDYMQPCVGKRGTVSATDFVLYPSPEGLIAISSDGLKNVTASVLTREQWAALSPEKFVAFWFEGVYVAFVEGTNTGYVIDALSDQPSLQEIALPTGARVWDGVVSVGDSALCLLCDQGNDVYTVQRYKGGANLSYVWKSKQYSCPEFTSMAVARVRGEWTTGVVFTLYGDGVQVYQRTVSDNKPFRLPAGKWRVIEAQLSGSDRVEEVTLATSVQEIMQLDGAVSEALS